MVLSTDLLPILQWNRGGSTVSDNDNTSEFLLSINHLLTLPQLMFRHDELQRPLK